MAFTSGSTPFGIFDNDAAFAADANKLVKWVAVKLGGGLPLPGLGGQDETHVQVELSSSDVYSSFEEATVEYGSIVNSYQAKSALAAFLGSATGTLSGGEDRYPKGSLEWARRQAQPFGEEAYVGGDRQLFSGSITVNPGQQVYNLSNILQGLDPDVTGDGPITGSDGRVCRIIMRQVFQFSPFASFRFFGTTAAINYLNGQFDFQSFTPESVFYLLPVWEDILRGSQFKVSNKVRRSNYSYELHGADNELWIYPVPTETNTLFFTYNLLDLSVIPLDPEDQQSWGVSNLSNVPFGNIPYSMINSIGRQWIWKMTLAFSKEILGLIRRKMRNVPIPDGNLDLDGSELVNDARAEMDQLRSQLRELLEDMTYDKLAEREAQKDESLLRVLSGIPLKIYVG